VRAAILTGCRQGELLALLWRNIEFDHPAFEACEIVIEDSKSGEPRRVPLHPNLARELYDLRQHPEAPVFTMPAGTVPHPSWVSHKFKRAAISIGRGDLRFHDLRHLAGTRFQATGANLNEIAALLGHKTLHMARRYSHMTKSRMHDLVGRMAVASGQDEGGKG
jgi:integrase